MANTESSGSEDYDAGFVAKRVFDMQGFPLDDESDDDLFREVSRRGYISKAVEVVNPFADGGQFDEQADPEQPEEQA